MFLKCPGTPGKSDWLVFQSQATHGWCWMSWKVLCYPETWWEPWCSVTCDVWGHLINTLISVVCDQLNSKRWRPHTLLLCWCIFVLLGTPRVCVVCLTIVTSLNLTFGYDSIPLSFPQIIKIALVPRLGGNLLAVQNAATAKKIFFSPCFPLSPPTWG